VKLFHCDHCRQPVFFENVECVSCKHALGFLPDLDAMASLEPAADGAWRSPIPGGRERTYRHCANRSNDVCNWMVRVEDPGPLCESCRLTRVIPDLSVEGNRLAWYRLEVAKRRLLYSLRALGLTPVSKADDDVRGLAFEFLADTPGAPKVFTGHSDGVITLNVAEADDVERERRRTNLHEPYRTLLGHFRHESGHYSWNVLIENGARADGFRAVFGDERASYADAVKRHYDGGAPAGWQDGFISAYATMHPWEDWAETWAHYLHMSDALETARASGLSVDTPHPEDPSLSPAPPPGDFDALLRDWHALSFVLNNLNRGLGLPDGYPFVLSAAVAAKLAFVHEVVQERGTRSASAHAK
jgi:hypothetical protein